MGGQMESETTTTLLQMEIIPASDVMCAKSRSDLTAGVAVWKMVQNWEEVKSPHCWRRQQMEPYPWTHTHTLDFTLPSLACPFPSRSIDPASYQTAKRPHHLKHTHTYRPLEPSYNL